MTKAIVGNFTIAQLQGFQKANENAPVTVNGVALETYLKIQTALEAKNVRKETQKSIAYVVAHSRSTSSRGFRNTSGARSGRGRVIFSCGGM